MLVLVLVAFPLFGFAVDVVFAFDVDVVSFRAFLDGFAAPLSSRSLSSVRSELSSPPASPSAPPSSSPPAVSSARVFLDFARRVVAVSEVTGHDKMSAPSTDRHKAYLS